MKPKALIDRIAPDPALDPEQCKRDASCHRVNGHKDECKTVGVVVAEKLEARARLFQADAIELARSWARKIRARGK